MTNVTGDEAGTPSPSSRGHAEIASSLSGIELEFIELMAKGFDPVDASRSLGISFLTGAQLQRRLSRKLNAIDDRHFRHLVQSIARSLPAERYAVLEA